MSSELPDLIDEGAVEKYIEKRIAEALMLANGTMEEPEAPPTGYCYTNTDQFPCSEDSIVLVSLGLATGALGLLMVLFLMQQVSPTPAMNNECLPPARLMDAPCF
jgi:hypothetical protein